VNNVIDFKEAKTRLRPQPEDFRKIDASYGGCISGNIFSGNPETPTFTELEGLENMSHINDLIDIVFNRLDNKNEKDDNKNKE
jgi:hypothetical protein